jgi:hypothetical protein
VAEPTQQPRILKDRHIGIPIVEDDRPAVTMDTDRRQPGTGTGLFATGLSLAVSSPNSASSRPAICSALSPSTSAMLNTQLIPTIPGRRCHPVEQILRGRQGSGSRLATACDSLGGRPAAGAHPAKGSETTS